MYIPPEPFASIPWPIAEGCGMRCSKTIICAGGGLHGPDPKDMCVGMTMLGDGAGDCGGGYTTGWKAHTIGGDIGGEAGGAPSRIHMSYDGGLNCGGRSKVKALASDPFRCVNIGDCGAEKTCGGRAG